MRQRLANPVCHAAGNCIQLNEKAALVSKKAGGQLAGVIKKIHKRNFFRFYGGILDFFCGVCYNMKLKISFNLEGVCLKAERTEQNSVN